LFQPPLSQGLHWYNVYIYSKRIPHNLVPNQAHKNTFYFILPCEIVLRFCQIVLRFFTNGKCQFCSKNRTPIFQIGLRFWQLQQTSISQILSHFHNNMNMSLMLRFCDKRIHFSLFSSNNLWSSLHLDRDHEKDRELLLLKNDVTYHWNSKKNIITLFF